METTIVYWGYIGVMEKKMETPIVYWVHIIGIMEKKMETTIMGLYGSFPISSIIVASSGLGAALLSSFCAQ